MRKVEKRVYERKRVTVMPKLNNCGVQEGERS
jgi:hypothetical protein